MNVIILGVSAFFHDAASALIIDGEVAAAVQEERVSRTKNDASFPERAIHTCLSTVGVEFDDVDLVAFYEKPHLKLRRLLATAVARYPTGREYFRSAIKAWSRDKFWTPGTIRERLFMLSESYGSGARWNGDLLFVEHHRSHAASAFYPSPFQSAAIVVLDGVGEWATTSFGVGHTSPGSGAQIELLREVRFPHSIGLLYSAMTHFLGFEVNDGEYKVMGLAPYGSPIHCDALLRDLVSTRQDGSFALNMNILTYDRSYQMYDATSMERIFGIPPRVHGEKLNQAHADIAASVQAVTEELILGVAQAAHIATGESRVVLAGGVALNCVANGRILAEGPFDDVWVQPAAGDAGGALGAALEVWHAHVGGARPHRAPARDGMRNARLGPEYDDFAVAAALAQSGVCNIVTDAPEELIQITATLLAHSAVIAWFQGRLEFGPRALGGRSILANPAGKEIQSTLNLRVKGRESFRPFAPVVLREKVAEWFALRGRKNSLLGSPDGGYDSPYMLLVAPACPHRLLPGAPSSPERRLRLPPRPPTMLPACTHIDYSARIQTVGREDDVLLHRLLTAFLELTGIPALVNTSFNLNGEPIVCSPQDAVACFLRTDIDFLVMNRTIAWKTQDPEAWLRGQRSRVEGKAGA